MPMNEQLFIVLVWAHVHHAEFDEVIYMGESPVMGENQEAVLRPAIDEQIEIYNMQNTEKLPDSTGFFATIKTSYRGIYFDANDNNPSSD